MISRWNTGALFGQLTAWSESERVFVGTPGWLACFWTRHPIPEWLQNRCWKYEKNGILESIIVLARH